MESKAGKSDGSPFWKFTVTAADERRIISVKAEPQE